MIRQRLIERIERKIEEFPSGGSSAGAVSRLTRTRRRAESYKQPSLIQVDYSTDSPVFGDATKDFALRIRTYGADRALGMITLTECVDTGIGTNEQTIRDMHPDRCSVFQLARVAFLVSRSASLIDAQASSTLAS